MSEWEKVPTYGSLQPYSYFSPRLGKKSLRYFVQHNLRHLWYSLVYSYWEKKEGRFVYFDRTLKTRRPK